MKFKLNPEKVFYTLLSVLALLTIFNLVGISITQFSEVKMPNRLLELVNFDKKENIPTFFSALLLLFTASLLALIANVRKQRNKDYKLWLGLCLLFVFFSVDEAASFHQLLLKPAARLQDLHWGLYPALLAGYTIVAGALLILYLRFLFKLASPFRLMFMLSALIYFSGAIVVDTLLSSYYSVWNAGEFGYAVMYTLEELLEMIGTSVFIYSLLFYIQNTVSGSINFRIQGANIEAAVSSSPGDDQSKKKPEYKRAEVDAYSPLEAEERL